MILKQKIIELVRLSDIKYIENILLTCLILIRLLVLALI